MKKNDFRDVCNKTPLMRPVFRLIKDYNVGLIQYVRKGVRKGTEVYIESDLTAVVIGRTHVRLAITAGYLKFVEYRDLNRMNTK